MSVIYAADFQNVNCYKFFINLCITQLMIQYIYGNYLFPIKVNKVLLASGVKMWDLICANLPQPGEY